jgi:hypothetical protein
VNNVKKLQDQSSQDLNLQQMVNNRSNIGSEDTQAQGKIVPSTFVKNLNQSQNLNAKQNNQRVQNDQNNQKLGRGKNLN